MLNRKLLDNTQLERRSALNKTTLVITTINIPVFLKDICENAKKYGKNNISIIVIGDVKTPTEIVDFCNSVSKDF